MANQDIIGFEGDQAVMKTVQLAGVLALGEKQSTLVTVDGKKAVAVSVLAGGGGAEIGQPVTGATAGSVLYIGPTGLLEEHNPGFTYVQSTGILQVPEVNVTGGIVSLEGVQALNATFGGLDSFMFANAGSAALTGISNIAIGDSAMKNATTAANNVVIGVDALANLVTLSAPSNVVIGARAAEGLDAMESSVAIGKDVARLATSMRNSVVIGVLAYENGNVAGSDGVYIGFQTGQNVTTVGNVAVGTQALRDGTGGGSSIAIGTQALVQSNGGNNTAVGNRASQTNTSGINNVSMGNTALLVNTTGSRNVVIGAEAMDQNIGNDNTVVGYQAGDASVSGNGNILIGNGVDAPLSTTDDFLNIGNLITGVLAGTKSASVDGQLFYEQPVLAKTASDTITEEQSNTLFTNEGAIIDIVLSLPACRAGLIYEAYIQSANRITFDAAAGDTIRNGADVSVAGGTIDSATIGNYFMMVGINATEWVIKSVVGTWTIT